MYSVKLRKHVSLWQYTPKQKKTYRKQPHFRICIIISLSSFINPKHVVEDWLGVRCTQLISTECIYVFLQSRPLSSYGLKGKQIYTPNGGRTSFIYNIFEITCLSRDLTTWKVRDYLGVHT